MAKNKLGRGLGAILEDVENSYRQSIEEISDKIKEIDISLITPNPFQPRRHFDEDALKNLSESILKHGLLQPIIVVEKDDGFMLIAGERRLRATKLAKLDTIKAIVTDYESKDLRELALIENIQRENLNPIELAHAYQELINQYNITQEELASIIYKSRTQITNTLRLLNLTQYTKDLIIQGKLSQGHAKVIIGLDKDREKTIVDTVIGQKLSVRETENLIKSLKNKSKTSKVKPQIKNIEYIKKAINRLSDKGFTAKTNKDGIVIKFKNEEELEKFLFLIK